MTETTDLLVASITLNCSKSFSSPQTDFHVTNFPLDVTDGVSLKGIVECNFVPVWANKLFKCPTPKTCKQTIISMVTLI